MLECDNSLANRALNSRVSSPAMKKVPSLAAGEFSQVGLELFLVPRLKQAKRVGGHVGVLAAHADTPRSTITSRSARIA